MSLCFQPSLVEIKWAFPKPGIVNSFCISNHILSKYIYKINIYYITIKWQFDFFFGIVGKLADITPYGKRIPRPRLPSTPEVSQVRCQSGKGHVGPKWGMGFRFAHSLGDAQRKRALFRLFVRPWYHSARTHPFMPKRGFSTVNFLPNMLNLGIERANLKIPSPRLAASGTWIIKFVYDVLKVYIKCLGPPHVHVAPWVSKFSSRSILLSERNCFQ